MSSPDVLVIGGGPAGSSTATWLARQGLQVWLLEGKHFPRHHIGESLLAVSMPLLKELGVEHKLRAAGFLDKEGAIFVWGPTRALQKLKMSHAGKAFQVTRSHFDQLLLAHAREHGVRILEGCWARQLLYNDRRRICGVRAQSDQGDDQAIFSQTVVDASGLTQFIPRQLGLPLKQEGPKRVALSAYYRGALRPDPPHTNDIISEAVREGWLWYIPLTADLTSVGFVTDVDSVIGAPQQVYDEQIADSILVKKLLKPATRDRDVAVLHYTNHIVDAPLWHNGYVLVGDTAFFVDPLFSTGVHSGLYAASLASAALTSVLTRQVTENEASRWYEQKIARYYARVRTTIRLLYGLHPGEGQFWRRRYLADMSDHDASRIARELGPEGMSLFINTTRTGTLTLPSPLARRVSEFVLQARRLAPVRASQVVVPVPGLRFLADFMRFDGRLVPALVLEHQDNRVLRVEYPSNSFYAGLLQALDGQRTLANAVRVARGDTNSVHADDERAAGLFLGALVQTGLLQLQPSSPETLGASPYQTLQTHSE